MSLLLLLQGSKTARYKEGHLVHCLHQKWEEVMEGLRRGRWKGTGEASLSVLSPALRSSSMGARAGEEGVWLCPAHITAPLSGSPFISLCQ